MTALSIGKVAGRAGIGIETIRFYEREGLIDDPPRGPSGYRQYPESVVTRLLFIKRAKELGFTLSEIKELLSLRADDERSCEDVRRRAEAKITGIESKIKSLERIKKALVRMIRECNQRGSDPECPILDALDGG